MKKVIKIGIFFVSHSLVFSEQSFITEFQEHEFKYSEQRPKETFVYFNPGVTTFTPVMFKHPFIIPDLALGMRTLSSHHVFDRAVGFAFDSNVQLLYLQLSYLFFPHPSEKFYFGAGVTCGVSHLEDPTPVGPFLPFVNVPITLGYQFPSDKHVQFVQLQATPFGTATISYGFGF